MMDATTATTAPKKGAKQFRDPLVKVLGELSGMRPNQEVEINAVYSAVCMEMGITIDQFGNQGDSGSPWVERWCQWSFKDMTETKPPLTVRMGKGKWALTPQGVSKAQSLCDPSPAPSNVPGMVATDPVPFATDGSAYHPDPYIRSLAIQETKCYDYFSDQSPICAVCPMQTGCINAQASALSDLARVISLEDAKASAALKEAMAKKLRLEAEAKAAAANAANRPTTTTSNTPKPNGTAPAQRITGAQQVICQQGSVCKKCSGVMVKDSEIVWVRGASGVAGLFHLHCYAEKVAAGEADPIVVK